MPTQTAAPVSVILVNWNGRHHLAQCLPALAAQTYPNFHILVVDNASSDGSCAYLADQWPAVRVLALSTNCGFAVANNRAIAQTDAPWVALLNNDTVPDSGWLAALVAAGEQGGARLAAVASRMVFFDRPAMLNSAGIAIDPAGIAWDWLGGEPDATLAHATPGVATRADATSADATPADASPVPVFGASGGAALYRRAALLDVAEAVSADRPAEVFDERFFMYLEDVDLAWRLQLRGWQSVYQPAARVLHHGSASSGEGSPFKNRLLARNKVWTVLKNYPTLPLLGYLPIILAYDLASAPYRLLFQGQTAALAGRLDAWAGLRGTLARRNAIQARRTAGWAEIRSTMAPLEPPWAVLRRYRHLVRHPS